jgi:hypothetical protein
VLTRLLQPKLQHLTRAVPWQLCATLLQAHTADLRHAALIVLRQPCPDADGLNPAAVHLQVHLPLHGSGLGLLHFPPTSTQRPLSPPVRALKPICSLPLLVCAHLLPRTAPPTQPGLTCVSATTTFAPPPPGGHPFYGASRFHDAARTVRRALHATDMQRLFKLKPGVCNYALLHSLSAYPGSKWLDTLLVVPSLCLDDQSFQDNACVRLGVCNFTTMSQAQHCTCGKPLQSTRARIANRMNGKNGKQAQGTSST